MNKGAVSLLLALGMMAVGSGFLAGQEAGAIPTPVKAGDVVFSVDEESGDVTSVESVVTAAQNSLTMIWLVVAGALVFFMQAGFAMVEVGLTRAKNAGNILMKNLMDFALGALAFLFTGWAIMYGASMSGIFGTTGFFLIGYGPDVIMNTLRDWFFQVVFAATAATIVSGAMAERTKFSAYLIYSVVISAVIYPVSGHWIWHADGWLYKLGFHDFAGSTVVHSVGGWSALMGALILGPRLGKYVKGADGKTTVKAIPGHNLPLAALGVFILWFGWYGFNAGSTLSGNAVDIGWVAATTTLGAAAGATAAMATTWIMSGKPEVSMSLNGALAGLVAITAPTAVVDPIGAVIIGLVGGVLVVLSVEFIDKVLHIDDPVGAVSVHAINGVWGTLAVGLFANGNRDIVGLFYGGGFDQLGKQFIGVVAVMGWVVVTMAIVFFAIKATVGIRVSKKEELEGLDVGEHGAEAYPGFQIFSNM